MSDLEKALRILSEAEEALSTLMREALADQRYDDVARVAKLTLLLTDLVGSPDEPLAKKSPSSTESPSPPSTSPTKSTSPKKSTSPTDTERRESRPYPQFARDGDRLVKVGWSSKARQEYKHRTHRKVLQVFARAVRNRPDAADCFTMEDVLPLVYAGGKEIPSYQAYLALALLRSVEAIRKDGRDGYRADLTKLSDGSLNNLWESLPEHA